MNYKLFLILVIILLYQIIPLFAQEPESDLKSIVSDRFTILNAIRARDFETVIDLSDVSRYEESKYSFLWPGERLIIDLLTHTFFFVIKPGMLDSLYSGAYSREYNPPDDEIFNGLQEALHSRQYEVLKEAEKENLPVDDLIFIEILMKWLTLSLERGGINQQNVNIDSKSFLKEYPDYKYEEFINKNILVEPKEFELSPKIDFFAGTGIPTGDIADKVSYYVDFGIYPTMSINNHCLSLPISFGFFKTEDSVIIGEDSLGENEACYFDNLIINYGYKLKLNRVHITPNVGFGFETYHFSARSGDPMSCGFDFGVKLDFLLGQKDFFRERYKKRRKLFINLDIGMRTRPFGKNKPEDVAGNRFYSNIGIGYSSHFVE